MNKFSPEQVMVANIDMQRCFMPAEEGERLQEDGFGELPVDGGADIVPIINEIDAWAEANGIERVTTQDWHPEVTAHFGEAAMQWPVHGVAGTPGAELHPELRMIGDNQVRAYKKGQESIASPEEDQSYSGFNGIDETGETLGAYVQRTKKAAVVVVGLALGGKDFDTCIDSSAKDFAAKTDAEVFVVRDATRAIVADEQADIEAKLEAAGVTMIDTAELFEGRVVQIEQEA